MSALAIVDIVSMVSALALLVAVALLQVESDSLPSRPRRVIPDRDAFIVPVRRRAQFLNLAVALGTLIPTTAGLVHGLHDMSDRHLALIATGSAWACGIGLVIGVGAAGVQLARWNEPQLRITAAGVRGFRRSRTWDELADPRARRWLPTEGRRLTRFADWDAAPQYVGQIITYYLEHPERRAAIGTFGELDRVNRLIDCDAVEVTA